MQANKALLLSNMLSSTNSVENADIANFEASCVTPLDITVDIDPVQEGSGDPSPDNIRPISGWTKATISHSGADTSNPTEYEIPFSTEVYGGKLNVVTGECVVEKVKVTPTWKGFIQGTYACADYFTISPVGVTVGQTSYRGDISSMLPERSAYWGGARRVNESAVITSFALNNLGNQCVVYDTDLSLTQEQFREKYSGLEVVYTLATPITLTLDPVEIRSLLGDNNVWSDTGNVSVRNIACNADVLELLLKTKLIGDC